MAGFAPKSLHFCYVVVYLPADNAEFEKGIPGQVFNGFRMVIFPFAGTLGSGRYRSGSGEGGTPVRTLPFKIPE